MAKSPNTKSVFNSNHTKSMASPPKSNHQTCRGFLNLPREMRDNVYSYYFAGEPTLKFRQLGKMKSPSIIAGGGARPTPALFLASRQLYLEGLQMRQKQTKVDLYSDDCTLQVLTTPRPSRKKTIKARHQAVVKNIAGYQKFRILIHAYSRCDIGLRFEKQRICLGILLSYFKDGRLLDMADDKKLEIVLLNTISKTDRETPASTLNPNVRHRSRAMLEIVARTKSTTLHRAGICLTNEACLIRRTDDNQFVVGWKDQAGLVPGWPRFHSHAELLQKIEEFRDPA